VRGCWGTALGQSQVLMHVDVEVVADTENWVNRVSEASGLILAGFRDFLCGRSAEARISAALLGCIGRTVSGVHRTELFRGG
jgi:hypothetical protein